MANKYDWDVSDISTSELYELYGRSYKIDLNTVITDLISVRKWIQKYLINRLGFNLLVNMENSERVSDGSENEYFFVNPDGTSLKTSVFGEPQETVGFVPFVDAPRYNLEKSEPTEGWLVDPTVNIFIPITYCSIPIEWGFDGEGAINTLYGTHKLMHRSWWGSDTEPTDYKEIEMNPNMVNVEKRIWGNMVHPVGEIGVSYVDLDIVDRTETPVYFRGFNELFKKSNYHMYPFKVTQYPQSHLAFGNMLGCTSHDYFAFSHAMTTCTIGLRDNNDYNVINSRIGLDIEFEDYIYICGCMSSLYTGTPEREAFITVDDGTVINNEAISTYQYCETEGKSDGVNVWIRTHNMIVYKIEMSGVHTLKIRKENNTMPFYMMGYIIKEYMQWW